MTDRHTPGPWWIDNRNIRSATVKPDWMPKGIKLATVVEGAVGSAESDANARLIAAAPDLLAALQAIMEWAGTEEGYQALPFEPPWNPQVQAAIARATGEQAPA
jgi:hypothetical protein